MGLSQLAFIDDALRRTSIAVLNEPTGYPRELFFDSIYHLTEEGKRRRTEALIRTLRPVLGP